MKEFNNICFTRAQQRLLLSAVGGVRAGLLIGWLDGFVFAMFASGERRRVTNVQTYGIPRGTQRRIPLLCCKTAQISGTPEKEQGGDGEGTTRGKRELMKSLIVSVVQRLRKQFIHEIKECIQSSSFGHN